MQSIKELLLTPERLEKVNREEEMVRKITDEHVEVISDLMGMPHLEPKERELAEEIYFALQVISRNNEILQ